MADSDDASPASPEPSAASAPADGGADAGAAPPAGEGRWLRAATAALRRGVRDPVVVVGAALLLAALALKVYVLRHAYFVEDDFLFFGAAGGSNLTADYLTELHKGHFMPGAKLLVYLQTAVAPYNWPVAAGTMLLGQAAAAVALFRLLWVLFGRRWAILTPLVVYAFAPLTVPVLAWWSAALNGVPFQLAMALALLWTVRYLRGGESRHAWLVAAAVVFGMAFSVKAVFLPPLLFVVAAGFLVRGRFPRVLWTALDRDLPFWVGMALLSVGYGLVYLSLQDTAKGEGAGAPEGEAALTMARRLLGETFPAGAVGGPVEWGPVTPAGGLLNPTTVALAVAWSVIGVVVVASLLTRRRSWRAWAILVGYLVCADIVPTVIARGRYESVVGFDPRYVADAALVFAVCLGFAFLATREERDPEGPPVHRLRPPRAGARAVAAAATAAFTLVAGYSTATFADTLSGDRVRWYLDTVRASTREVPAEAGLYPRPVPEDIVLPWNGPRRLSSHVLSPLAEEGVAERIRDPEPANTALVFNDAGYLVGAKPAKDSAFFGPPEGEECVATFGGQAMWEVKSLGGPTVVLSVAYTSEQDTTMTVVIGDAWVTTRVPAAPDGGVWYVPVDGAGTRLLVGTEEKELCMTWVTFGELRPVTQGNPWQQEGAGGDGEKGGDGKDDKDNKDDKGGTGGGD